ncbi:MAG: acetoin utilization protein AcuC [Gemmatimonadota bacterium]
MSNSITALVWDDVLAGYRFGAEHPLNPRRLEITLDLIRRLGLVGNGHRPMVRPAPATDADLLRVHAPEFIDAVKRASAGDRSPELGRFGLGSEDVPLVAGMHEAACLAVGATLKAAELVMSGRARRAFSLAGGLHHARRAEAAGFCVYNDLAVAAHWMKEVHGARVMYIDIDAHHGDGVQWLFYEDPEVLTVSFHESGTYLFPGTGYIDEVGQGDGHGFSVNVPLDAHTEDASYRAAFEELVPALADAFRPDVILYQAGCDAHAVDPLTHLRCTTGLYHELTRVVVEVAERHCQGRVVATGGGGYAIYEVVPRAWTLVWAALCGAHPPDELPAEWLHAMRLEHGRELPCCLRDAPGDYPASPRRASVDETNERTLAAVRSRVLPLLTGWHLGF